MAVVIRGWSRMSPALSPLGWRCSARVQSCSTTDKEIVAVQDKSKGTVTEYVTPDELVR